MLKMASMAVLLAVASISSISPCNAQSPNALTSIPADAVTITHWYKQHIYNTSDANVGEIEDVLVEREGRAVAFIVGVGGFLGMGEKHVAVPFNAVQFKTKDTNKWYPVINTTVDALKNAPGFVYDRTLMTWVPEKK
jgi:sporulation protein YlmC with PRC-barrel domain